MKHSAKAAARLARQRAKLDRQRPPGTTAPEPAAPATVGPSAVAASTGGPSAVAASTAAASTAAASTGAASTGAASTGAASTAAASTGAASTVIASTGAARTGGPGGLAAAESPVGRLLVAQLPYAVVLAGIGLGLLLIQVAKDAVRGGTFVIAGALLAGSVGRLVLPEGRAGLLRSRRRLVDVAVFGALGVGLLVAGLIVQLPG
jgi:Protein of unknown function (DUF3017)